MKIILLQDLPNIGKKFDIKDVKAGYARNFLFPKGLAKPATYSNMKDLELQKQLQAQKAEEELAKIQELAGSFDGLEVLIPVKVGEQGQLYESVGAQHIVEKLKELGYEIKKSFVKLDEPLKELGEFPVLLEFDHGIEAKITVIITEAQTKTSNQ